MLFASIAVLGVPPQAWWQTNSSVLAPPARAGGATGGAELVSDSQPQGSAAQLECGVLWFLHVCKTGGTTVKDFLKYDVHRSERNDWRLVNLMSSPCDPKLAAEDMGDWTQSARWSVADEELRRERPKLMVHQHSCSPGMGAHLLPQLQALNATLQRRSGGRCRVALTTVLRRPADLLKSSIFFNGVPPDAMRDFVTTRADYQIKYLQHGGPIARWPATIKATPATPELLRAATTTLSHFELVGRTEDLGAFVTRLAGLLGVTPPGGGGGGGVGGSGNATTSGDGAPANAVALGAEAEATGPMLGHAHSDARKNRAYELSADDRFWMHQHLVADEWLYGRTFDGVAGGVAAWPQPSVSLA